MLRAEMPFEAEVHDRGIGPPVLVLSGHTVGLEGGATLRVTLEIAGLSGQRLDELQDAVTRRLGIAGGASISLLPLGDARGRPLLSLAAVEVPAGERHCDERYTPSGGRLHGRYLHPATKSPLWPGGPTGRELRLRRREHHLGYRDLAAILSISANDIGLWERGRIPVPARIRPALLKAVGLDAPASARDTEEGRDERCRASR